MDDIIKKIQKKCSVILKRKLTGAITSVITDKPVASLTFDDGPEPKYTRKVLDILDKYNAKATFFMVGKSAQQYPDVVKLVADGGHAIGNHSWSHHAFTLVTSADRLLQIRRCEEALGEAGQKIFRPPYGMGSHRANMDVLRLGYKLIGWSVESADWHQTSEEFIANSLINNIGPGSIVLLHDRIYDGGQPARGPALDHNAVVERDTMLAALECVLEKMRASIQFVTIPELLRTGRAVRNQL